MSDSTSRSHPKSARETIQEIETANREDLETVTQILSRITHRQQHHKSEFDVEKHFNWIYIDLSWEV
jgi:hypothetical protein